MLSDVYALSQGKKKNCLLHHETVCTSCLISTGKKVKSLKSLDLRKAK